MNEDGTSTTRSIRKAYRLKLDPNEAQAMALARSAGACRWLWNHLLAMEIKRHARDGTFVFFHELSKLLPAPKLEFPWLADVPSNALVRVCRNLDRALREAFPRNGRRKGFPRFKARGRCRDSFYVIGQAVRVEGRRVVLPKIGSVRFRAGRWPEGRIVGGSVTRVADDWFATLQCEIEVTIEPVEPVEATVIGVDLGLSSHVVTSDGETIAPARRLRQSLKRLRRAQRRLARKTKGSSNRRRQARAVARIHARVANQRSDATHKLTRSIVDRCTALACETLNVRGMLRNPSLALSLSDANLGETLRQLRYKCEWAGKTMVQADRFFPSTQLCSGCGNRKTGEDRLSLGQRTYRCDACGLAIDRDLNAARNLRRYGLERLRLVDPETIIQIDVGRVTPERAVPKGMADACGDPPAGPVAYAAGRRGSRKQEVASGCKSR